jgi:DNA invertase Pin-like site-specific DNA recombinase
MATTTARRGGNAATAKPQERLGISYARYSTDRQGSIPEQEAVNGEVAAEAGVRLVAWFSDAAVSRSLADREGLAEAFAYLEANREVRFVVVNELERLTAGVAQRAKVVELCKRLGVTIVTEDLGAIDPYDDEAMFEADQRAVAGHGEVLKVRRRTRRALKAKVRSGVVQMRPPFGVRMKPVLGPDGQPLPPGTRLVDAGGRKVSSGEIETDPDELPWLRKMFTWADEGQSDEQIAARLTEAGVRTKNGHTAWRGTTVGGILTNPFYKGEMRWGRFKTIRDAEGRKRMVERDVDDPEVMRLESPLGALIDPVLFERVQTKRAAKVGRRGTRRTYGTQLFDDFVYCGRCGHKMYGRNDAAGARDAHRDVVIWRYYCYSSRPGYQPLPGYGKVCTENHSMQAKKILAGLALLTEAKTSTLVTVRAAVPEDRDAQRKVLAKQVADLRAEHQRAVDLAVKGLLTEDEFATAKADRERAIADATARLDALDSVKPNTTVRLSTDQRGLLAELVELLGDNTLPVEDRRDALRRFGIQRLYVDNPNVLVELAV